jgi:tetratricopeptide (TPR) repeat protein
MIRMLNMITLVFTLTLSVSAQDQETVAFSRPAVSEVKQQLTDWIAASNPEQSATDAVNQLWADDAQLSTLTGEATLDLLIESFAKADTSARQLLQESYGETAPSPIIFDGIRARPIYQNQIQLFRARWLTQHRHYDDALPILEKLSPDNVVDPAGLLFYRALCQSELLKRREALETLSLLLVNTTDVPGRFRVVAEMLQQELITRKDDGMQQVAALMKDVERRLDLGDSGEQTQGQEDEVIAALDKLLEELDQQNGGGGGGGGGAGSGGSNQPSSQGMQDSGIKGGSATGEADRKELKETGRWGMADKKAEAKAKELIRQKFPPNFLDQIGRYTRKVADKKK